MRVHRRLMPFMIVLSALSLVAASCGDDDEAAESSATASSESADVTTPPTSATPSTASTTSLPETTAAEETTPADTGPASTAAVSTAPVVDPLDALYEEARVEGALTLYSAQAEPQVQQQIVRFNERFPDIDVSYIRLSATELQQRFLSEQEAGVHELDVLVSPDSVAIASSVEAGHLIPLADAELPGSFPPEGFPEEFVRADGATAVISIGLFGIAYNTELVAADAAPTSWEDVLDPSYSGEIVGLNPATTSPVVYAFWNLLADLYGDDFLSRVAAQSPDFSLLPLPGLQALGAGEAAVVVPAVPSAALGLAAEGAPIEMVYPNDTTGSEIFIALTSKAPHPAAARLFIAYALSEEGANLMAADSAADVSPWGGGGHPLPPGYVTPDISGANTDERKAQINELLGV